MINQKIVKALSVCLAIVVLAGCSGAAKKSDS